VVYVTPGYSAHCRCLCLPAASLPMPTAKRAARGSGEPSFRPASSTANQSVGRYIDKDTLIVARSADVSVSSGLYEGAPLMSEQGMYIPAAQLKAQELSLVHVWFQPDWIVRTAGPWRD